jgi:hypothetical protein
VEHVRLFDILPICRVERMEKAVARNKVNPAPALAIRRPDDRRVAAASRAEEAKVTRI